jgi:imidazolonepropionase-like amidohydrolase
MTAGADEAHKAGLSVAAHAHSPAGIRAALAAGVDSIEHAAFMTGSELEQMRHRSAFLVPTAIAVENVRPGSGIDPEVIAKTEAAREQFHASTAAALSLGIKIAAGTDAGTALNPVGPTLLAELLLYARLGADNRTVLAAATVNAGSLVGQGLGVIEAGRPADMIILDRNPLDSLDALADIAGVISRGRLLNLTDLDVAAAAITGTGKGTASA